MGCSLPGSSVHGISQARILEWVAIYISRSSHNKYQGLISLCCAVLTHFSPVQLFGTLWTVACQDPLSMGFPRQQYWSELPFPSLGDLSDPGVEPRAFAPPALAGVFFTTEPPGKPQYLSHFNYNYNPLYYYNISGLKTCLCHCI